MTPGSGSESLLILPAHTALTTHSITHPLTHSSSHSHPLIQSLTQALTRSPTPRAHASMLAGEGAFLDLYQQLSEAPDPAPALAAALEAETQLAQLTAQVNPAAMA